MRCLLSVYIITIALSFCGSAAADDLAIGLLVELSGSNAANGTACRKGFEAARLWLAPDNKIGSRNVRFVYGDHQGDSKTGVTEFNRFIDKEKVVAVVMTRGQVTRAINPISTRAKIPVLATVGQKTLIADNPYAFRFWMSPKLEGQKLAQSALSRNLKTASMITLEDEYTMSVADGFEDAYTKGGGKIVSTENVTQSDTDIASKFIKLHKLKPDVLSLQLTIGQYGAIIKKLREHGITQPIVANLYSSDPGVIASAGKENADRITFLSVNAEKPRFRELYNKVDPNSTANGANYVCYAALATIAQAITDAPQIQTGEELFKLLSTKASVKLLDEELPIIDRELILDLAENEIKNGSIVAK